MRKLATMQRLHIDPQTGDEFVIQPTYVTGIIYPLYAFYEVEPGNFHILRYHRVVTAPKLVAIVTDEEAAVNIVYALNGLSLCNDDVA